METNKYRVWDEEQENMFYSDVEDEDCLFSFQDGLVVANIRKEEQGTLDEQPYIYGESNFDVEQFIDIKDKYGKDIYDGDIVDVPDCMTNKMRRGIIRHVITEGGSSYMFTINGGTASWIQDKAEIIGNIHENPELLEAKDGS